MHYLEQTCRYFGLECNVKKTEAMGVNTGPRAVSAYDAKAVRAKVGDQFSDIRRWCWLIDWSGREQAGLTKEELERIPLSKFEKNTPEYLVVWDDENVRHVAGTIQWNGWIQLDTGRNYRIVRYGSGKHVDPSRKKFICEKCDEELVDSIALKYHKVTGWCIKRNEEQQRTLRRTRKVEEERRAKVTRIYEIIDILAENGERVVSTGLFKYLGTLVSSLGDFGPEVSRRLGIGEGVFQQLQKVWGDRLLSRKTKLELYESLVLSIVLYNAEVWELNKNDERRLNSFHRRCIERIFEGGHNLRRRRKRRTQGSEYDASLRRIFNTTKGITGLITIRRAKFIGHAVRNRDRHTINCLKEESKTNSQWWKNFQASLEKYGCTPRHILDTCRDMNKWNKFLSTLENRILQLETEENE